MHGGAYSRTAVMNLKFKTTCSPDFWTQWGEERVGPTERVAVTYMCAVWVGVCACSVRCGLCNPMGCSPPGSSVHGIFQARILEWVAIPFSRGSSPPRDRTWVSWIAGRFFASCTTGEAQYTQYHLSNRQLGDVALPPRGLGSVPCDGRAGWEEV